MSGVIGVSKRDCSGCTNDVYNHSDYGMNKQEDGKFSCWSRDTATLVKARDVHRDLRPPYLHIPLTSRPSCYKASGYSRVKPEALDERGFWRL